LGKRDTARAGYAERRSLRDARPSGPDGRAIGARTARWLGGGAFGVLGVIAVLMLGMPAQSTSGLEDELVAAHVRSLSGPRLTDVQASDRQRGKPWFDRRIGFSPIVVDLAAAGFPLLGTRLDHVGGRPVAVMVYGTSLHPITLFVRPKPQRTAPLSAILRGDRFSMLRWESGPLEYFAVSDVDEADLEQFRATFRQASQN
jgi:anti-sigma factor RsiW